MMENIAKVFGYPTNDSTTTKKHENTEYPNLGLKVFFVGSCFLTGAIELFAKAGCKGSPTLEEADLVVFLGGEDVDPSLYGEKAHKETYFNADRDAREIDAFTECLRLGKPIFGICRGMQFLHVMAGGKLWQHVRNHGMSHLIKDIEGNVVRASSMHHQMCREFADCFPIAYALADNGKAAWSGSYEDGEGVRVLSSDYEDLEAAVYPNITAIAVQGHPEVGGYSEYSIWCLQQIKEFLTERYIMGDKIDSSIPFLNQGIA